MASSDATIKACIFAYGAGDYLGGETVSIADLFVTPILAYLQQMPESSKLLAAAPNIQRAQAVMRQRPSFAATDPQRPG